MVMVIIYRLIALFILVIVVWSALDEDDSYLQATAALVSIPILLRVLMIK
jgi:hypothetical protein